MGMETASFGTVEAPKPRRLKEYAPDFGNSELQKMLSDLLERHFGGFRVISPASRYDDQIEHFDVIAEIPGGTHLAPDFTGTVNEREMQKKVLDLMNQPLVQVHDDRGKVVSNEELPKIIVPADIIEYGRAYNRFLLEQKGKPIDYLSEHEAIRIAGHVVRQIDNLPEALRRMKKPEAYINRVMEKMRPVKEYFAGEWETLKRKKRPSGR